MIDGRDIRTFDLVQYRRQLGIVSQVPFLFSGTVADNIRYAMPGVPEEEMLKLAKKIGDGEWLETLPDGLHTSVGERGNRLSMGQRQLVALMRVLVQNPAIFILDEATASIDPFTEWQIQQALNLILKNTTSILIAHRLSTVKAADRIVVMQKGAIIEQGNHDGLLRQNGHYAELYNTYFTFAARARSIGIAAAWIAFAVNEVYALVSGVAYLQRLAAVESGPFLSAMALLVVVMGPFLVVSMGAVHAYANPRRKLYSLAALAFMVACVSVTSCINFSLLVVSSLPDLFAESSRSMFLPATWPTPAFVLDNFVWDWFFGVSMLLAAPVFGGDALRGWLRLAMLASGSLCLAGLVWLAVSPSQAIIIGILGWGAAGPIAFLLLAKVFGSVQSEVRETPSP